MKTPAFMETERLLIRQWRPQDREPFYQMNSDPEVMRYFEAPYTREQSDGMMVRAQAQIQENGYGFWALEIKATGEFIGFTGIGRPTFSAPFMPCVEIG